MAADEGGVIPKLPRDGKSAYEIAVAHGFKGSETEWLESLKGLSAYELWLKEGNSGTVAQFLASLGAKPKK